ncbi:MAG: HlyD family secretion protein [Ignavibacteria bacterium]|nr:HlyD family secretion protein [Ignavibacteria bacterium]
MELIGISAEALTTENIHSTVSIRSPISGVIRDVKVNIGSCVDANSPIAEIVDNSQLHLDLFVYEKDLPKVSWANNSLHTHKQPGQSMTLIFMQSAIRSTQRPKPLPFMQ